MNLKKLSLAGLLLMTCSFGFAETSYFVKVTKESQLVPGNRYIILYNQATATNPNNNSTISQGGAGVAQDLTIQPSKVGSTTMSLIVTDINTSETPDAVMLEATDNGYALLSTATNKYIHFGNGSHLGTTTNAVTWTITANGDGTFKLSSEGLYLRAFHPNNTATPQWDGSSSGHNLELYLEYGGGTVVEQTMITFGRSTVADESGEIDTKYYASVCFDYDFMLDYNETAYGIEETFDAPVSGYVPLNLVKVQDPYEMVWAGTPVLLVIENDDENAPAEVQYPIYVMKSVTELDEPINTNLVGNLEETDAPENSYKLGRIDDVVGFWYAYGNGTIKANKAYIQAAEGSEIKGFTFNFADATGIKAVSAPEVSNEATYNLIGQQVTKNYKGVVVKNGKKFLNK